VSKQIGPQTEESIGIVESLNVPVIVCFNKIDTLPPATKQDRFVHSTLDMKQVSIAGLIDLLFLFL
jgi:translation initiation factor IF-2